MKFRTGQSFSSLLFYLKFLCKKSHKVIRTFESLDLLVWRRFTSFAVCMRDFSLMRGSLRICYFWVIITLVSCPSAAQFFFSSTSYLSLIFLLAIYPRMYFCTRSACCCFAFSSFKAILSAWIFSINCFLFYSADSGIPVNKWLLFSISSIL